ncbi:MAG: C39 family peptidase [Defluviitaleaceae bacterium]|nr:C39 family peptidase [Defluviitaleaceae bacterium]
MRKFLAIVVAILFIISGIYIHSLYIMVESVRVAQRERGEEFEAIRSLAFTPDLPVGASAYETYEPISSMLYDVFVNRQIIASFTNLSDARNFAESHANASIFEQNSLSWVWDNHPQFELHVNNVRILYNTFAAAREAARNYDNAQIIFRRSGRVVWSENYIRSLHYFIENVPLILQQPRLPRGCGVVSIGMLINFKGIEVDKMTLAEEVARHPNNPYKGFIGCIYSWDNWGYGVYHGPIYDLLYKYLPERAIDITGADFEDLYFFIEGGNPVWVVVNSRYTHLPPYQFFYHETDDGFVRLTWRMHAVLITGFDDNYIYFNDPNNVRHQAPKAGFIAAWEQMGRQAVTVS